MHKRLIPTLLAISAAAITLVTANAAPASASTTWYGAQATVYASSWQATHTFTISPATTPMSAVNSQWVTYQVIARDVSTNGAWRYYNWQGPYAVYRTSPTTTGANCVDPYTNNVCSSITIPAAGPQVLSSFTINGLFLHRYDVWVNYGYWVGNGYAYLMVHAEDCWNHYLTQGITSQAQGATCAT